jgi:hypothetical protein
MHKASFARHFEVGWLNILDPFFGVSTEENLKARGRDLVDECRVQVQEFS